MNIKGKKIIFITPQYFGYEKYIKNELESMGAEVITVYENLDAISMFYRMFYAYFKSHKEQMCNLYYKYTIGNGAKNADIVLVIRGESLYPSIIKMLKNQTPEHCKYIMYQWDSVINNPGIISISSYFDRVFTFDRIDSYEQGWEYRPLFFIDSLIHLENTRDIDLLYICSLHSKRADLLKKLKSISKQKRLILKDYVFSKRLLYYKHKFWDGRKEYANIDTKDVKFKTLSIEESYICYSNSKVVVDYTHPDQTGYTMRTIECIGNKCKLLTNNKSIKNADFYNENNIQIFEEDNIMISDDFLNGPYCELPGDIYKKYSIESWLEQLLGENND